MKKLNAQQLVEFLLVVPFMVIILGILTEFAYALNVNMTLYNGLRTVSAGIYSQIRPNMGKDDIQQLVYERLEAYLGANNISVAPENNLTLRYLAAGKNAAFIANYTYVSAFTLPNVYFHVMPEVLNFSAIAVVPSQFLLPNDYPEISSVELDKIWGTPDSFSQADGFKNIQKGMIANSLAGGGETSNLLLLVPVDVDLPPFNSSGKTFYLVNWNGSLVTSDIFSYEDYAMYDCSDGSNCTASTTSADSYISGKRWIYAFHKDDFLVNLEDDFSSIWLNPSSGKVSDATDGALKRAMMLNSSIGNDGNYDGLMVSLYNASADFGNSYMAQTNGSYVFVHNPADGISGVFGGSSFVTPPSGHFGE